MLQGSLDDFALSEVLGLLASTSKSGRLRLSGNRGTGSLWLDKGHLTAAEASKIPGKAGVEDVVFEMLRFADGTFSFMLDDTPSEAGNPEQVDFVVQLAQDRLAEWRTIESVVPSLAHTIGLADELPGEELEISRSEWKTVIAVSGNATVQPVCDQLGLDEVDGSRRIMQMIQRGLLTISDPETASASAESVVVVAEAVIPEPVVKRTVAPAPIVAEDVAPEVAAAAPVIAETVISEVAVAEMPAFESPVVETPAFESPVVEMPAFESPVVETPAFESPVVEAPAFESPVVEAPAFESPVVETHAFEESVAEVPVADLAEDPAVDAEATGLPPLPERPSGAASVLATSTSPDFMAAPPIPSVEQVAPAADPFAPPPGPSPFGHVAPAEAPMSAGESDSSLGRPPMPSPPSPSEIESFSANLEEESPFENGELLDESLTGAKEEGGSILMRYLRNDR